ncbi:hypothetical protein ADL07_17490 [Streptomyces sp. NRRL F-4707]|nr:hypothetical protein ADL07_17490 [Streptomyces sp. NRRL F-4707]
MPVTSDAGGVAELLDVDMDELTRTFAFVVADDLADGPIHPTWTVQAVSSQGAVGCRQVGGGSRAVEELRVAFGSPATDPLVGGGAGDAHFVCDVRYWAARSYPVDQERLPWTVRRAFG